MKTNKILALLIPLCLPSCNNEDVTRLEDEIRSSTELITELERSSEEQFDLIIATLASQQKQIAEIGLKMDNDAPRRRGLERANLELRESIASSDRALASLKQAIMDNDQKQREAALTAAEEERVFMEKVDREAVPIRARLKQLEAQRLSIEQRMEAVINRQVEFQAGAGIGRAQAWLKEDIALKKKLIGQLDAEAAVVDKAIADQEAQHERLYRR